MPANARANHVLHVAEKPSVAKEVARILSNGNMRNRPGVYGHALSRKLNTTTVSASSA